MLFYKSNSRGFTLIELLVVIAIIGTLSSIVIVSLNTARAKARDTKRLSEIRALQTALELYYVDYGNYPSTNGLCSGAWCAGCTNQSGLSTALSSLVTGGYIKSLPVDPKPTTSGTDCYNYEYYSNHGATGNPFSCEGINAGQFKYAIRFTLEKTTTNLLEFQFQRNGNEYCAVMR